MTEGKDETTGSADPGASRQTRGITDSDGLVTQAACIGPAREGQADDVSDAPQCSIRRDYVKSPLAARLLAANSADGRVQSVTRARAAAARGTTSPDVVEGLVCERERNCVRLYECRFDSRFPQVSAGVVELFWLDVDAVQTHARKFVAEDCEHCADAAADLEQTRARRERRAVGDQPVSPVLRLLDQALLLARAVAVDVVSHLNARASGKFTSDPRRQSRTLSHYRISFDAHRPSADLQDGLHRITLVRRR
jgi:hypothetical protein